MHLRSKHWNKNLLCDVNVYSQSFPLCLQGSLLNQLAIANESLGGGTVVVMAERDKEEMELDIAKMEFDFKGTSVICRSGSPLILADLKKVDANSHLNFSYRKLTFIVYFLSLCIFPWAVMVHNHLFL